MHGRIRYFVGNDTCQVLLDTDRIHIMVNGYDFDSMGTSILHLKYAYHVFVPFLPGETNVNDHKSSLNPIQSD